MIEAAWIVLFYVAANLTTMRLMIRRIEPLPGETAWLLLTLVPALVLLWILFFFVGLALCGREGDA